MKTIKIKQFTFAALAALMTVLPVFAAEQNQSWWQQLWDGIRNYAQQNPKTAATISAAGALGAYCAVKFLSPAITLEKVKNDKNAQEKAINAFADKIACQLRNVESSNGGTHKFYQFNDASFEDAAVKMKSNSIEEYLYNDNDHRSTLRQVVLSKLMKS